MGEIDLPTGFDWEYYLQVNKDVAKCAWYNSKDGAIRHWKSFGHKENRIYSNPNSDDGNSMVSEKNSVEGIILKENTSNTLNQIGIKSSNRQNKIVVYTAISNGYDELKEINNPESGVDYVCFTDTPTTSETWKIREIPKEINKLDSTRKCRNIKVNPHLYFPEYDYSVWVDGNIRVIGNIKKLVQNSMSNHSLVIPKHPFRDCIYEEAEEVKIRRRDVSEIVDLQISKYTNENYPKKWGLVQSNVIVREHNNVECINIGEKWWEEILNFSKRDQLSFNYVCWKNGFFNVGFFDSDIITSEYFKYFTHNGLEYTLPAKYGELSNFFNGIKITKIVTNKEYIEPLSDEIKSMKNKTQKLIFELPHSKSTSGGVRETLKISKEFPGSSVRFQKITDEYPKIPSKWTVGYPDNTFPDCDVCITYSDTKNLNELTLLPQVKKVFIYMLSYGMSIERERKNVRNDKVTVLCSSKKIEAEIKKEGVTVHRVGFPLDMSGMYVKNTERKNYVALLFSPNDGKRYSFGVSVVDEMYKKGLIEGVVTFGTGTGYEKFKHPMGLIKHYSNANREEINEVFNQCKCFLMPSISEGLNLTPVESTICGCPAVICDGAINEVFFDKKNCIVTEKDNMSMAIKNVTNIINNFKQYSESFLKEMVPIVNNYTMDKVIRNIENVLYHKQVVIIPVHDQLPMLQKCVESVIKETPSLELIIVDDGSTDSKTINWINELKNCTVIRHKSPEGFSKSCNDGIDYAMENFDFDCLCLLNSDTEILTPKWFTKIETELSKNENVGLIGVASDNAVFQTIHNVPNYLKSIDNKPTLRTTLIHGFCFFITKKLISSIGRFDDETFPHYGSEDDYSIKSVKSGFKNIIVGSVLIKHKGSSSYSTETRAEHLKKSMPNFISRWGQSYVDILIKESQEIQKKLNG